MTGMVTTVATLRPTLLALIPDLTVCTVVAAGSAHLGNVVCRPGLASNPTPGVTLLAFASPYSRPPPISPIKKSSTLKPFTAMKKYFIILLMALLPALALAQQAGGHITRPTKPATTTTTKPPQKQTPPKRQSTTNSSTSDVVVATSSQTSKPQLPSTSVRTDAVGNKIFTIGNVQFTMVKVDGGTFTMGSTNYDALDDEKPAHSVTLSSYYIGQTEVTQALWQAVMGNNPSKFKGARRPVEQVSWNDCQTFIRKLNSLTGQNFKLPTEAQWEYAARGGRKSRGYKYAGSNDLGSVAWYTVNSYDKGSNSPDYGTHNVATKQANELGLYDMSGNVWEWCSDWKGYYGSSSQTNPTGPYSGSARVTRGGGWNDPSRLYYVSGRCRAAIDWRGANGGLRLAL